MHVLVNGVRLFFDVEGASLRPSGDRMDEKPTLLLLHGGPGVDHSLYKPAFSALAHVAQVVYLDHRGNGRSESGPKELWTVAQWADDVKAFCDAVGITRPIVYGASFGGLIAMAYATRHPDHPARLVLVSTAASMNAHVDAKVAMFTRLGGPEAGALAHRRFVEGDTSADVLQAWLKVALPLYTQTPPDPDEVKRIVFNEEPRVWFNRPGGEARTFDCLRELHSIRCPTLVLGGQLDPMCPIECQRDIAAALPPDLVQYREFENCGHGVVPDVPEAAFALLEDFIKR